MNDSAPKNVLITGGAGFIGANLAKQMVASDVIGDVRVLDNLLTGKRENLKGVDCDFVEGSILDRQTVSECLDGVSAVVHLAARPSVPLSVADPVASHEINVNGTYTILEAVREVERRIQIIFASSSSVYGANTELPKHEGLVTRPVSPYAASKLSAETMLLAHQATYDIPALAFRFFNVFGPLQPANHAYAAVIPAFLDAALADKAIPVHGDGLQSRDFTYIDTVTQVIESAVVREVAEDIPVNLAYGSRTDLLSVIALIEAELGTDLELEYQPSRPGDVRDSQADDSRVRNLFGDVEPVELAEGLRRTIGWFKSVAS